MDEDFKRLEARVDKIEETLNLLAQRLGIYNAGGGGRGPDEYDGPSAADGSTAKGSGGPGRFDCSTGGGTLVMREAGGSGAQPNYYGGGGGGGWADIRGVKGGR